MQWKTWPKRELTSWKKPEVKKALIENIKENMKENPEKITNSKLIRKNFDYWLYSIKDKSKIGALAFHPALEKKDEELLNNVDTKNKLKKLKFSAILTSIEYAIYFFGLRHRALFYSLTKKNPGVLFRGSRLAIKYFIIPLFLYNVNFAAVDYSLKDATDVELKEAGLLKKYNLEYIVEDKPF